MASVWLARLHGKHGFEKLVAVKTILPQYASDLQFQRMFLDEARIASGIEHTNVAQILDLGEQHEILYIVMEWVDGDSLSRLNRALERKGLRIPAGALVRIIADTCGGLHAAHELTAKDGHLLGVVHRDVSPQNILVSVKGVTKLIDFGIAKARDRVAGETNAGNLKGKILYMAPEQALGKPIDRRADVWAVGAVLYHMLSGKPPYEGENQLATLHMLATPSPPSPLPASVPKPIAQVVMAALVHDPDKRIATAAELQQRLESALVEAKLATTGSDVAALVREHLGDRAEQRRQAVDLALEAAADRARMQNMLQPAASDSSSGVKHVPPPMPASVPSLDASSPGALTGATDLEPRSGATLDSASLVTPQGLSTGDGKRKRTMIVVGAAVALSVVMGVVIIAAVLRGGDKTAAGPTASETTGRAAVPTEVRTVDAPPTATATAPATTTATAATATAATATTTTTATVAATTKPLVIAPKPTAKPSAAASTKKTIDDGF